MSTLVPPRNPRRGGDLDPLEHLDAPLRLLLAVPALRLRLPLHLRGAIRVFGVELLSLRVQGSLEVAGGTAGYEEQAEGR